MDLEGCRNKCLSRWLPECSLSLYSFPAQLTGYSFRELAPILICSDSDHDPEFDQISQLLLCLISFLSSIPSHCAQNMGCTWKILHLIDTIIFPIDTTLIHRRFASSRCYIALRSFRHQHLHIPHEKHVWLMKIGSGRFSFC